jgi:hypothetical protein
LDGTTKDTTSNGALFRPGSLSQVLAEYPDVVLAILRGSRTTRERDPDGHEFFVLSDPGKLESRHKLRRQDFERCVSVAKKLGSVQIFRSEPRTDTYGRIRAHLRVEFADRTDP